MSPRTKGRLLVVVVVLLVNLPLLQATWTNFRVDRFGTDVTATVTDERVLTPGADAQHFLEFTFPAEVDPDQNGWTVRVDRATYDEAVRSGELEVRVLPDQPSAYAVDGEVPSRFGLVSTIIADVLLLVLLLLLSRFRGRLRPELRLVALEDVETTLPGSALDKQEGQTYLVQGEVSAIEADEIVLDLGDRSVRVLLDGHHNPVPLQQPARVRGRMIG